jgi:hypothetical protein
MAAQPIAQPVQKQSLMGNIASTAAGALMGTMAANAIMGGLRGGEQAPAEPTYTNQPAYSEPSSSAPLAESQPQQQYLGHDEVREQRLRE